MRRDFYSGRSTARAQNAMVATSHPQATLTGLDLLRNGGTAVDAGIGAMALLSVIEPQATGIGGDCFAIYAPQGRPLVGLNGSGRAAAAATPEWYTERGFTGIPIESPHAVTLPGAVDAWFKLHQAWGRLPWAEVLAPAIAAAENGYLVTDRVARDWDKLAWRLAKDEVSARTMLRDGQAPRAGDRWANPGLARSLRKIATEGRDGFYCGEVAEDLIARLSELGGLQSLDDLAGVSADWVTPVSTLYRGIKVSEIPPNGQGITALMMLNGLAAHDLGPDVSLAQRTHLLAEATKAAYRRRDALIGDPAGDPGLAGRLLSQAETARIRAEINPDRAGPFGPPPDIEHRDTTYLCVVDQDRNALSLINSLFEAFGTGISTRNSGILLQNRGSSFRLQPHPNQIAPGKRPMHTIIPGMAQQPDGTAMPFGVMGGHYQATGHAMLLSGILDRGLDPQTVLDEPRSFATQGELQLEPGFDDATRATLSAMGHALAPAPTPMGGGQVIWTDPASGALMGGSEPRKDGIALGF